jgi:CelD/BcsL family acetyltransferase involved in cellulose biosynthesis
MTALLVPLAEVDSGLHSRWRDLAERAIEPNPFTDPDFVLPVAEAVRATADVALAVVERDGAVRFAQPVIRARRYRRLPVAAVTTWLHDYASLGTPLVAPEDPEQTWREAVRLFDAAATVTSLGMFAVDGPVHRALDAALAGRRRSVLLGRRERPILRRRPGQPYLSLLSADRRKVTRKRHRQLAQELGGELKRVDHAGSRTALTAAVDGFLALEAAGWKGADGGAMACRPGHADFFRTVCTRFAARGALQFWSLEAAGRTVAYECVLLAGHTMFFFKTTYDEQVRRFGPGAALLTGILGEAHDSGRYEVLNSCTGLGESLSPQLFPDRQVLAELVLPPAGPAGATAVWLAPRAASAYRRLPGRRPASG